MKIPILVLGCSYPDPPSCKWRLLIFHRAAGISLQANICIYAVYRSSHFSFPGIRNASIMLFVAFSVRRFSSSFLFIVYRLSVYTIKNIFLETIYPDLIYTGICYLSGSVIFCYVKQITFLSSGFRMFSSHDHIP